MQDESGQVVTENSKGSRPREFPRHHLKDGEKEVAHYLRKIFVSGADGKRLFRAAVIFLSMAIVGTIVYFGIFQGQKKNSFFTVADEAPFYGISGEVLEIGGNYVVVSAPTMATKLFKPAREGKWLWKVLYEETTAFYRHVSENSEIAKTIEGESIGDGLVRLPAGPEDLRVGARIFVQSKENLVGKFQSVIKEFPASEIVIYPDF
jgi:hypothetical protein